MTLVFLGCPLAIALAGGVGRLILMSMQRDAELALSGIVGTTPGQRLAMPVMEALIISVTGGLLPLVMVAVPIGFLAAGLPAASVKLHCLPSLRRPEPRVMARLVAE